MRPTVAGEQGVAGEDELRPVLDIDEMAGGVAGAGIDVEGELADRNPVALGVVDIGLHRAKARDAVGFAGRIELVEQELVLLRRPLDRHVAEPLGELRRAAAWSKWPCVRRIFSTVTPARSIAWRRTSTSPPGSTTAARPVARQATIEAFCSIGVTGMTIT